MPRVSTYITALVAGPYAHVHSEHDGIPLGLYCRAVAGAAPRRRGAVHRHPAGLRLLPPGVRLPLPVRQVRPAVRPRVQRRGDGERRLRDLPRGLRLPVQGDRRGLRAAGRDDPARDGAHVVRRPRDHALVGRPVAQRVASRPTCRCSRRAATPAGPTRGRPSPTARRPGPTGRTSCPRRTRSPPTSATWTTCGSTSTASPTPRARRCSSSWSRGSGRTTSSPAMRDLLPHARVRQHGAGGPARRARGGQRPRPGQLVGGVARDRGGQHAAPGRSPPAPTALHVLRDPAGGAGRRGRRCARTGSPSGCTTSSTARWCAPAARSSTSSATRPTCPALVGAPQPDLVLVNDDDLTYAKIRLDERSLATLVELDRRLRRVAAPRAVLVGRLGHDPRRRAAGPRLRLAGAGRDRRETDIGVVQSLLRQAQAALTLYADPAAGAGRPGPARRRPRTKRCWRPPRAATCSWPAPARSPRSPRTPSSSPCSAACSTAAPPCRAWRSTPTCAGTCCCAWSCRRGRPARDRGRAGPRPHRGRRAQRRRGAGGPPDAGGQGRRRGSWPSRTTSLPNAVQSAVIGGFNLAEDLALPAPFVEQYFAAVDEAWRTRPRRWRRASSSGSTRRCRSPPSVVERTDAHLVRPTSRRRCAGCCSRAGTASCGRCGPASGTPPRADPDRPDRPVAQVTGAVQAAVQVRTPTTPSTARPFSRWNSRRQCSVRGPRTPSGVIRQPRAAIRVCQVRHVGAGRAAGPARSPARAPGPVRPPASPRRGRGPAAPGAPGVGVPGVAGDSGAAGLGRRASAVEAGRAAGQGRGRRWAERGRRAVRGAPGRRGRPAVGQHVADDRPDDQHDGQGEEQASRAAPTVAVPARRAVCHLPSVPARPVPRRDVTGLGDVEHGPS